MSINIGRQVNLIGFHSGNTGDDMPTRRFPPPWTVEDTGAAFVVRDHGGQKLAYVYYEEEPGAPIICLFGPPWRPN